MAFDWIRFLDQNGIEYVTKGSSVTKDHVAIRCPWCGSADPSQHLSISLSGKGWRCFRQPDQHKGRSPVSLVSRLLGVSLQQASLLTGEQLYIPENFSERINKLLNASPEPEQREDIELLEEFKPFSGLPSSRPYVNYMVRRGFKRSSVVDLADQFDMHYAVRGAFHHRIIFPIYHRKQLITWTGRSINPQADLRYMTLTTDPENNSWNLPVALAPISDQLFAYNQLRKVDADTIYLVEGPFDALKIWYLGQRHGVVATCFFTATASANQIELLHELLPRFKRRILLLDEGTMVIAMRLTNQLTRLGVKTRTIPKGLKDPGELEEIHIPFLRKVA